jgi:hypothetical protein
LIVKVVFLLLLMDGIMEGNGMREQLGALLMLLLMP